MTRFLPTLGYFLGMGSYLVYYVQDAVNTPSFSLVRTAAQGASTIQIISTIGMLIATLAGGILSDKLGRRKPFVIVSMIIVAIGLLLLGFFPTWQIVMIGAAILGLGFGMYLAVDLALVTQVLPSANNRAKDMGIINIAMRAQSLGPVIAGFFIRTFNGYTQLFVAGAIIVLLGSVLVLQIKSVR